MKNRPEDYLILVGVEEEVFIVNDKGFLAPYSDIVARNMIEILRKDKEILEEARKYLLGIQWEPNPSQLEYVTRPTTVFDIFKNIEIGRMFLARGAKPDSLLILPYSIHPVQSAPHPINGTHINVSVHWNGRIVNSKLLFHVFRHIRNYLPEIIALTANSPIIRGHPSGYASSRLVYSKVLNDSTEGVLKRVNYYLRPREKMDRLRYAILFQSYRKKEQKIIIDRFGNRLLDITIRGPSTNILEDTTKKRSENRIEIRAIDNQLSENYLYDVIKIIAGLTLEGVFRAVKGEKIATIKNYNQNKWSAVKDGINAQYIENDGRIVSMKEKVRELIDRVSEYLDLMGLSLQTSLKDGVPECHSLSNIKIIDDYPELNLLSSKGKLFVKLKISENLTGYTVFGDEVRIPAGRYLEGLLAPYYTMDIEKRGNIIKRIRAITIKYWLVSKNLYVPIDNSVQIVDAWSPIKQLYKNFLEII